MNGSSQFPGGSATVVAGSILVLGAMGAWGWWTQCGLGLEPVGSPRDEARRRNLAELEESNKAVLEKYGWQDQQKGIVRLPVSVAMELVAREWSDGPGGREKLMKRMEFALGPLPEPEPADAAPALEFE